MKIEGLGNIGKNQKEVEKKNLIVDVINNTSVSIWPSTKEILMDIQHTINKKDDSISILSQIEILDIALKMYSKVIEKKYGEILKAQHKILPKSGRTKGS